jgi:hypothetical protein
LCRFLEILCIFKYVEFLLCPQDEIYTRYCYDLVRPQLGITSGDDDIGLWRMAESPSYHLAAFSVSPFRHAAGVDDANIRLIINTNHFIPLRPELSRDGGGFSEIQLAAEGMDSDSPHRYEKELPVNRGQLFPFFIHLLCV